MRLTENFELKEFRCKDGTDVPEKFLDNVKELANRLEVVRKAIDKPITILSGYRTEAHNKKVMGKKNSKHLTAEAADIVVKGIPPTKLKEIIEIMIENGEVYFGGIGLYKDFLHVDIRTKKTRW